MEGKIVSQGNNLQGPGINQVEEEIKKSKPLILQDPQQDPDVEQEPKSHSQVEESRFLLDVYNNCLAQNSFPELSINIKEHIFRMTDEKWEEEIPQFLILPEIEHAHIPSVRRTVPAQRTYMCSSTCHQPRRMKHSVQTGAGGGRKGGRIFEDFTLKQMANPLKSR